MSQQSITDAEQAYRNLGVTPIINASGSVTRLGGSRTRPEVLEQMAGTARVMVNIDELNRKAGEEIARLVGSEAAMVSSGAAGGLLLQAAACIAGSDPVKMQRLPETEGMKNEIIMQTTHRFPYDHAYRAAGAKIVEIGNYLFNHPWELEGAINERTAAVAYLCAPFTSKRVMPLAQVCEIAHAHDVPVIVDAASMLPPRANLQRYLRDGADMVIFSGGKGVRGPPGDRYSLRSRRPHRRRPGQRQPGPVHRSLGQGRQGGDRRPGHRPVHVRGGGRARPKWPGTAAWPSAWWTASSRSPASTSRWSTTASTTSSPTPCYAWAETGPGPSAQQVAAALQQGDPPIYLQQLRAPDELMVDPAQRDRG